MELTERHHKVWSLRLNLTQRAKTYPDNTLIYLGGEELILLFGEIFSYSLSPAETIDRGGGGALSGVFPHEDLS